MKSFCDGNREPAIKIHCSRLTRLVNKATFLLSDKKSPTLKINHRRKNYRALTTPNRNQGFGARNDENLYI